MKLTSTRILLASKIYLTYILRSVEKCKRKINVALNACAIAVRTATPRRMQGEPWQIRLKAAKLTQRALGRIIGKPENTISRQLRGEFGEVPEYLIAIIIAWEGMTDDQRDDWISEVERERRNR